jgi:hypothetical protein
MASQKESEDVERYLNTWPLLLASIIILTFGFVMQAIRPTDDP